MTTPEKMQLQLSAEHKIILDCCCSKSGDFANTYSQSIDWPYLVGLSKRHGVAGFVTQTMGKINNTAGIPAETYKILKRGYYKTAYKNTILLKEYRAIARSFTLHAIDFMPLKGIAFLEDMYSNIALRPCEDIDILVAGKDTGKAEKTLIASNYKKIKQSSAFRARHFHTVFYKEINRVSVCVELHWDIDYADSAFAININDILARAVTVDGDQYRYLLPSVEDMIILNTFHLVRSETPDKIMPLKNFCDVANIISSSSRPIDWGVIQRRAHTYKVLRPVFLVLLLLQDFFNLNIPLPLEPVLKQEGLDREQLALIVRERIFFKLQKTQKLPVGFLNLLTNSRPHLFRHFIKVALAAFTSEYYKWGDQSIISIGRTGLRKIVASLRNHITSLFLYFFDRTAIRHQIKTELTTRDRLARINDWLRNA